MKWPFNIVVATPPQVFSIPKPPIIAQLNLRTNFLTTASNHVM
jgi:hypothetical protein